MITELMPVLRTRYGAWLLGLLGVAGFCFLMSGVIEAAKGPNRRRGAVYLAGGASVIAAAIIIRLIATDATGLTEYGPADPAAPLISELMDEIRQMEHTS